MGAVDTVTLERLARLWLDGELPGGVLADALEEAGPGAMVWRCRSTGGQLFVGIVPVAEYWRRHPNDDWPGAWGYAVGDRHTGVVDSGGGEVGAEVAKGTAFAALWRELRPK